MVDIHEWNATHTHLAYEEGPTEGTDQLPFYGGLLRMARRT